MSQQEQSYTQRSSPSASGHSPAGGDATRPKPEEWAHIKDPNERRKIQNKLAQRRFRDKVKEQKDENEREAENRRRAGSAYASPEPEEMDTNRNLSGLPWGGISMRYVVETGKIKEQASQQSSRENSVNAFISQTGGSSRLGLCLTDHFARGLPAWKYLRHFPYNNAGR